MALEGSVWAGWMHEYAGADSSTSAQLSGGGNSFQVDNSGGDDDSIYFGGGLSKRLKENMWLMFTYNGEFSENAQNHTMSLAMRMTF
jgi:uncharacterized protein with beta-barrel porin domain